MNNRFMVIDVETTGNKVGTDKIIQIGAMLIEDGEMIEQFSSFVNPNRKLSPYIKHFTGIEDEMLKKAPEFKQLAPMLLEMLEGSYFVAHNVHFDLSFIRAELEDSGYEFGDYLTLDTVELTRLLFPTLNSYKLNQLAEQFSIEHEQPHRADSDAEVTSYLLLHLLEKLKQLPLATMIKLESLAPHFQSNITPFIQNIINEKKESIEIDEERFDIHQGIALKPQQPISGIEKDTEIYQNLTIPSLMRELERINKHFEIRHGQIEMIETIKNAFQNHHHGLIEAGTGTGKTIGYLIPAILFAKQSGSRVIISTYTTNLQEQIMTQEISILKKAFPFSFHATVLKGRDHYLCLRKYTQSLENLAGNNYDTLFTKAQILVWLTETEQGDVDELNLTSGGMLFWKKVKGDAYSCYHHKCPWFTRCFYQRKRKEIEAADIIITNHALLLSDVKNKNSILPEYTELIIDEAHHLDDVTSELLGVKLDYLSIQTTLNQLGSTEGSELLNQFYTIAIEEKLDLFDVIKKMEVNLFELKNCIDDLFRSIRAFAYSKNTNIKNEIGRVTYLYQTSKEEGSLWREVKNHGFLAIEKFEDLMDASRDLTEEIRQLSKKQAGSIKEYLNDLKSFIHSLEEITNNLCLLLFEEHKNQATWLEYEPKGPQNEAFLFCQSIDMSNLLADSLFAKKQSVILTSATLAVKDSFEYIKTSLGLLDFEVVTKQIPSPFSYKDQVQLLLPNDVPQIRDVEQSLFINDIVEKIVQIAKVTQGRMLILFTAYDMLEKTYQAVKDFSEMNSYILIAQGISSGSRARLTRNFKQHQHAILFGTSSFWEGIDIPGEDLSCIIIVRLPFSPPDNPIMAKKAELMKQTGKNAFMDLYLPQAILRFKQGFGRLVRAKNDRGAVFVLDRRITTKSYGKKFIQALPPIEIYEESTEDLLKRLTLWLR